MAKAESGSVDGTDKYSQNNTKTIIRPECRICLKRDGTQPVFGDESRPDISMEISMFGDVQVYENDDLPKFICLSCFKLLEDAISFRKAAKRSDALLRRRRKKMEAALLHPNTSQINEFQVPLTSAQFQNIANPEMSVSKNEITIDFVSVDMDETNNDSMPYMKNEELCGDGLYELVENKNVTVPNPSMKSHSLLYNCKYCSNSFQSSDSLEEHRSTVEHKRNYVMSFLPKRKVLPLLSQGKKTRTPKDHMCEFCSKMFTKVNYSRHMLSEHNIQLDTSQPSTKKECNMCSKMFYPAALNNHIKRIHGSDNDMKPKIKLECPICKKLFSKHFYPLHLQRHKQGDTRNYVCDQCGKRFFFKSSFFTHKLIHTNALPHKCEYCPYRGRTKELLKIHVRTHTGDYPYKCTQCDTRCSTKSNLNSHMRRHRGPIDFICDACNRGFYSKIQLERHISVTHYGVKNHICSICGAAFGYRHGLMSHQRKVHKRPKGLGKPKAVYLQFVEDGLLPAETSQ